MKDGYRIFNERYNLKSSLGRQIEWSFRNMIIFERKKEITNNNKINYHDPTRKNT